jgi:ketosteroid isomerase-like protein
MTASSYFSPGEFRMSDNQIPDPLSQSTLKTIELFNEAINQHNLELTMELMTETCVFENTYPAPDGERFVGQTNVRAFWKEFFETSNKAHFEFEEIFASGERGFVRWLYRWENSDGTTGHIRGVDIFRVTAGKVAEKFSYVKG